MYKSVIIFVKFWKFFLLLFYTFQREGEDAHMIEPQLKVEIEDGHEAP